MKSLIFTLPSTHATIKVNRKIKQEFKTQVVAAPKALKQYGCTIAILLPDINHQSAVTAKIQELGYNIKRTLEVEHSIR